MARRRAHLSVRFTLITAVILTAVLLLGAAVRRYAQPVVVVTDAVNGPVVQAFYCTGTIQPYREFPIKSNASGILTEVAVDKGDHLTKGQVLAIISDPAILFARDKAEAELAEKLKRADDHNSPVLSEFDSRTSAAQQMLEIAHREEQRLLDAMETRATSPSALDQASTHVKETWSMVESLKSQRAAKKLELDREVDVARAAVQTAQWNVDQQTLKSPIDGVVLDRPTSLGTRVAANDVLMRVADVQPANLVMRAAVDEEDIVKVHVGQIVKMTLYAFPGQIFSGKGVRVYDQADPERRTFEVDVQLEKPDDRLSPGMTGELTFIIQSKDSAIVVPSQAVQSNTVSVVRDQQLRKISIEPGLKSVERTEIISGISAGDRVVISATGDLSDGQSVRTQYIDPIAAAGLNKPAAKDDSFKGFNR